MSCNRDKENLGMMAMMMFCCAALPLAITYAASRGIYFGNPELSGVVIIIIFIAAHHFIMKIFCGHSSGFSGGAKRENNSRGKENTCCRRKQN